MNLMPDQNNDNKNVSNARSAAAIRRRRFSMERIHQTNLPMLSQQLESSLSAERTKSDEIRRPFTATAGTMRDPNDKPSQTLVTNSMLTAMLDESEPKRSATMRRSSMELLSSVPSLAHDFVRKTRRLSIDSITAIFDPQEKMRRELGITDTSKYSEIGKNIVLPDGSDDDTDNSKDDEQVDSPRPETENGDFFPNSPHPLIEYPPLYFLLKPFPKILNALDSFYRARWELKYPLQRPVFLSKKLRKIGVQLTWGECLFMVPFIMILVRGLVTSFVYPSVSDSGMIARLPLIMCFLTASHNSLLTFLVGIPFERAIKYHKISGYLAFLNGIFHTIVAWIAHKQNADNKEVLKFASDGQVNLSGSLLLCIIFSMVVTASPYVRRKAFEVFYYFHIFFATAMMGCAFYHSGILVPILASLLWGGDFLFRKLYMARFRYPRTASIIQLTDTVVEVRIPKTKGFDYNPGQYVKIAVPDLSIFEWHPISISSSPHQSNITLHIRKRGKWTTRLHDLALKKSEIPILLEGPYGSLSVDLTSHRYSMVMLLSGGIGVTPMQSIAHQLMYEQEWGERSLKKLWFVWTARDPQVMSNMDVVSKNSASIKIENSSVVGSTMESSKNHSQGWESISLHRSDASSKAEASMAFIKNQGFTGLKSSNMTDEELELAMPLDKFIDDEEGEEEDEEENDHDVEEQKRKYDNDKYDVFPGGSVIDMQHENVNVEFEEGVLELDCYLTAKEAQDCGLGDLPFVKQCRPDMKRIFLSMREEAIEKGEKRVAICVCAPTRLVSMAREACIKYSNRHVRFDFHSEVFD